MAIADATGRVQARLEELVRTGTEVGLQVAAYVDGELALDAWAGLADRASGRPVDGETLFTVFSATKGVAATAVHMLADRGRLEYDAPVARDWPEFAQNGKGAITLRQVLSHRSGLPRLPAGTTPAMMADWEAMSAAIAAVETEWPAGARTVYNGLAFGWVLGELVRRVDGRSIRQFVDEEIAGRLGAPDLHLGVDPADEGRVATLEAAPGHTTTPSPEQWNSAAMRRAIVPAAGGLFSARSLARMYAALAAGGALDGARLLSAERVGLARERQTPPDQAVESGMVFGLGYRLGATIYRPENPMSALTARESVFGHTGAGGSIGFADPERRFAVAVTKNLLRETVVGEVFPTAALLGEVREALGVER
jgi:CubicO group peptidase (beta-lactamase class C family)